jgi:hypothetical protein
MYGEMLRPKEAGSIPLDVGQPAQGPVENAPIDQIEAMMSPGTGVIPVSGSREMAQFTGKSGLEWASPEERAMILGKSSGKNNKIAIGGDQAATTSGDVAPPIIADVQKSVGPAADKMAEPTPKQTVVAKAILKEKIASYPTMTPEEKQQKIAELNTDPSIGQKLAMIAMAVAPTLVGYAAGGTKGAYLGAASTGKGLEVGAKAYQEEDQFNKELALKKSQIEAKKEKEKQDQWVPFGEDPTGNALLLNKETREVVPAQYAGEGGAVRRANQPQYNPISGLLIGNKYEPAPGQRRMGVSTLVEELDTLGTMASQIKDSKGKQKLPMGVPVDPVLKSWAVKHPKWKVGDPAPQGETEATTSAITNTFHENKAKIMDQLREYSSISESKTPATKQTPQEKDSQTVYRKEMEQWNERRYWQGWKEKQSKAEALFSSSTSAELKRTGISDPDLWFNYMKEIQGDNSVVREGDISTAMRFMELKTRIGGYLSMIQGGSQMTDKMRSEMQSYLREVRSIKEKNMMRDINNNVLTGMEKGYTGKNILVSGSARREAYKWAAPRMVSATPVTGIQPGSPMWEKAIKDGFVSGKVKNGSFVRDLDGDYHLIEAKSDDNGGFDVTSTSWVIK